MRLEPTPFSGLHVIHSAPNCDERGYFHRLFDAEAFAAAGVRFNIRQSGLSRNIRARTLRGMHYQKSPAAQAKLVRCLKGRLFDVAIDLRRHSATFCQSFTCELAGEDGRALHIPAGFAHGFLTLEDMTDILYELDAVEDPALAAGVRWNDARFNIHWPAEPAVINARDAAWPNFTD